VSFGRESRFTAKFSLLRNETNVLCYVPGMSGRDSNIGTSRKVNRRRFLLGALLATPFLAVADVKYLEPGWVATRKIRLRPGKPTHRFVHFTDLHHKGDKAYFEKVVRKINALSPEFVCFTGDVIEEKRYLADALQIFARIKAPVYGVPGNHDYWSELLEFKLRTYARRFLYLEYFSDALPRLGGEFEESQIRPNPRRPFSWRPGPTSVLWPGYPALWGRPV